MTVSTRLPLIACVVAFFIAGVAVIGAAMGLMVLLPFALIPLLAGIGILRKRVWSAYGMALYLLAQLFVIGCAMFAGRGSTGKADLIGTTVMSIVLAGLFFFAGRALENAASKRGWSWPWILLAACSSLPFLFVQPFVIPASSMEDTLLVGDSIMVQRFPKPHLKRGDMVVFVYPVNRRETFVKRIIGVPGDRIKIVHKVLYRNGLAVTEQYASHKTDYEDSYRDNFPSEPNVPLPDAARQMLAKHVIGGEVVVPESSYFVLGDNRDSSLDSRYWGFVSFGDVVGKPLFIYNSQVKSTEEILDRQTPGPGRVRWERVLKRL